MTEHGPATESLRHKAAQLTGQFDDTEVLRRASVATHPPQNVALLYETILDAAVEIMGADFASMQMLYPERGANGQLRLLASRGYPPDAAAAWEWIAADHATTCGIAMKTGRRVILSDVETQSDMVGTEARKDYVLIGMRSVQSTPLVSRTGALVGMVSTGWRTPHQPDERDLRLLDIVARQAADLVESRAAEDALRASEAHARAVVEASPDCVKLLDVDGRLLTMNANGCALMEVDDIAAIAGQAWCGLWPVDAREQIEAALSAARNGQPSRFEAACPTAKGTPKWWDVAVTPLLDAGGRTAQILSVSRDITESRRADAALRASERKYSRLFEKAAFVAALATYPEGVFVEVNDSFERMFGYSRQEAVGKTSRELGINPDVPRREQFVAELREAGHVLGREAEFFTRSGEARTCLTNVTLLDVGGRPHVLSTLQDITDRKRAEEQLRRSFGTYLALIENNPFGVYLVDADFRLAQISQGAQKVFAGIEPLLGRDFAEVMRIVWTAPFADEAIGRFRHTLATGEPYRARDTTEQRGNTEDVESYDWKIERVTLPDGRFGVVCHFYDMTERRRHEEHVRLLMHEVNHRSKNLLSVVQSIARQTAASGRDDFLDVLEQRLGALAASQNLLISSEWRPVALDKLVRVQLAHVEDLIDDRITLAGPPVRVSATGAQALGMALHELATNATKYGALAGKAGRVAIAWELGPWERGARRFAISWTESGGPPVTAPARRGFGSTVIERMAAMSLEAEVSLDFAAEGLRWRLECAEGAGIVGGAGE